MSLLEMIIQGRSLAMLLWQRETTLLYTMRYIGNIPFCYLIHREKRDHSRRIGIGKDIELSKALPYKT